MGIEFKKWILLFINVSNGLIWLLIAVLGVGFINNLFNTTEIQLSLSGISSLFAIFMLLLVRYSLVQIKKIIYNMMNKHIFTRENVTHFKQTAYPLFVLAAGSFLAPSSFIEVTVIFIPLRVETFLIVILGLLTLLMAHIFEYAMMVQQERNHLKKETELTI